MNIIDASPLLWTTGTAVLYAHAPLLFCSRESLRRLGVTYQRRSATGFFFGLAALLMLFGALELIDSAVLLLMYQVAGASILVTSLAFAVGSGLRIAASTRLRRATTRTASARVPVRQALRMITTALRRLPAGVSAYPWSWPPICAVGVLSLLAIRGSLAIEEAAALYVAVAAMACVGQMLQLFYDMLRELARTVALGGLITTVLYSVAVSTAISWQFHWPAPDDDGFGVLVQVNAALLLTVVATTFAVPAAWRRSTRLRFAWASSSVVTTFTALAASLGGMVGAGSYGAALFVVSIAGLPSIVMTLGYATYAKLQPSVGEGLDPATREAFQQAFLRAGGADIVGRPTHEVTVRPDGVLQGFEGGSAGSCGVVSPWDAAPVVLRGNEWTLFRRRIATGEPIGDALPAGSLSDAEIHAWASPAA